jgi:hypothetical protein
MARFMRSFQNRLDIVHSRLARRIIDNRLSLEGSATDVLLVKTTRNKEGDPLSYVVKDHLVVPVVWPPMQGIPYRSLKNGSLTVTSLVNEFDESENKNYEVTVPQKYHVEVDNLMFKVFLDDDYEYPAVVGLQVVETLGDFTLNMLVSQKCKCVLYTETLPQELIDIISEMAERRMSIGY